MGYRNNTIIINKMIKMNTIAIAFKNWLRGVPGLLFPPQHAITTIHLDGNQKSLLHPLFSIKNFLTNNKKKSVINLIYIYIFFFMGSNDVVNGVQMLIRMC